MYFQVKNTNTTKYKLSNVNFYKRINLFLDFSAILLQNQRNISQKEEGLFHQFPLVSSIVWVEISESIHGPSIDMLFCTRLL
jgi:hypothetical protein